MTYRTIMHELSIGYPCRIISEHVEMGAGVTTSTVGIFLGCRRDEDGELLAVQRSGNVCCGTLLKTIVRAECLRVTGDVELDPC